MAKLKDFLKGLSDKGRIYPQANAEFDALIGASALDIDVPDTFVSGVESNFLTRDRALNDPQIVEELKRKYNKNAFDAFDEKMIGFLKFVDEETADKIKNTKETYEKYDLLKTALAKNDGAKGKVNADANKIQEQMNAEIKALKDAHLSEKKEFEKRMNDLATDSVLKAKILSYNFAKPFLGLKENIADLITSKIRGTYQLQLDKGSLKLLQQSGDSLVEAFDGNEKLTADKLLQKELSEYVAVSNGSEGSEGKQKVITPLPGKTIAEMTLPELRQAQAAGLA